MKTKSYALLAAAVGSMLLASCGPQLSSTTVPMSSANAPSLPVPRGDGSLAGKIHAGVNSYRSSIGREALPRHSGLDRMARQHSEFMRENRGKFKLGGSANISHYGFTERALAAQRLMGMSNVAENVATCNGRGDQSAPVLVNAWKASSGHAKSMKGKWDATGIGVVVDDDGTVFATQIFANRSHSHMTMTDRMRQF